MYMSYSVLKSKTIAFITFFYGVKGNTKRKGIDKTNFSFVVIVL